VTTYEGNPLLVMNARLSVFLLSFFLILAGLELAMRWNGESFHALTDPLLIKAAILEKSPETSVLFLGTSRFVDGIEQETFAREISKISGKSIRVLNGATTGSQGDRSAYFAELATKHPGLTHVILEASPPALMGGELGFEKTSESEPAEEAESDARKSRFADRLESTLQDWFRSKSALVRHRKSLRPKPLLKLPVILLSDVVDPNIWSRKGVLTSLISSSQVAPESPLPGDVRPAKVTGGNQSEDAIVQKSQFKMLIRLCEIFEKSKLKVIWVAPPVRRSERSANHNPDYTAMYSIAAERFGIEFLDYAATNLDESLFRDPSHLNAKGRPIFSRILARDLAGHFETALEQE